MSLSNRYIVCGPVALLLGLALCWSDFSEVVRRTPGLADALPGELARTEDLDRALANIQRIGHTKQLLAGALAEGRLTLLEAAACCREVDRHNPRFCCDDFRRGVGGKSDAEPFCREVIQLVRGSDPRNRAACEQLARRLEAELQGCLDRGALQVPDADSAASSRIRQNSGLPW